MRRSLVLSLFILGAVAHAHGNAPAGSSSSPLPASGSAVEGWTDPVTQALQASAASVPMTTTFHSTASDKQLQQSLQDLARIYGAMDISKGGSGPLPVGADKPVYLGYNPATDTVLVNGQKVPRNLDEWVAIAAMPQDSLRAMSQRALMEDGFLPITQDKFRGFMQRIERTRQQKRDRWVFIGAGIFVALVGLAWARKQLSERFKAPFDSGGVINAGVATLLFFTMLYRLAWFAVPFALLWWIWAHRQ